MNLAFSTSWPAAGPSALRPWMEIASLRARAHGVVSEDSAEADSSILVVLRALAPVLDRSRSAAENRESGGSPPISDRYRG